MFWNLVVVNYKKYRLQHFLLLSVLILYSICGALIFCELESPNEDMRNAEKVKHLVRQSVAAKRELVERIQSMYFEGSSVKSFNETELRIAIEKYDVSMSVKPIIYREKRWNLWGGLYYAGTIYTTIGYGDMAAVTTWGRIFTMVYAIIGVPMVITILNDWGTMMFNAVDVLWKRNFNLVTNVLKKVLRSGHRVGSKERICDPFGQTSDDRLPDHSEFIEPIPLFLVAVVLIFWIVLCCTVFLCFENWTFFEALYFFFISLTTIGLGDVTPSHSVAVANFLLILIGLSIGSMAVNVIQMQLEILFGRIVKLIDKDFKTNLSSSEEDIRKASCVCEGDGLQSSLTALLPRKELDVIKQYSGTMSSTDRLLMRFLSHHQIKMLNEKLDNRAKMRNHGTQTTTKMKVAVAQTGRHEEWSCIDEEEGEEEQAQPKTSRVLPVKRLYIYNTGE